MTEARTETGADPALDDIVADADIGGRAPLDKFGRRALWILPLTWALYQLWIASPLPFIVGFVWNDTQTRSIHLGFAVLLAFLAFPGLKSSPRHYIPIATWIIWVRYRSSLRRIRILRSLPPFRMSNWPRACCATRSMS